ncbi:MAG TPA: alpha/beta fold hydrolase [Acidimicrobiales bacterium]|nr:alpha/beta fold hydrolase [Acidimicrobiales bacterium]
MQSAPTNPASGRAASSCANHKKRERVATCGACGSFLCTDCIVHTAVGVKCRRCTGGAAATSPTASARARHAAAGKRRRWAAPVALAGAVFVVVGAVAFLGRDGGGSTDEPDIALDGGGVTATEFNDGSFVDRPVDFRGGGGQRIGATLTIPSQLGGGRAPGVLIVPGGGAQDRNGGITLEGSLPDPLYQDLAESFAGSGLVSLRYDRRASRALQLPPGTPLTWDDLVADARAGLEFLSQRRETQDQPITVVGYDQGGFIAMVLAADPRVKGVVLISTPGRPVPEVLASDFLRGIPDPAKAQAVSDQMRAAAAELVATGSAPNVATMPEELQLVFSADAAYLRGLFSFDPVAEAAKVRVPALVVRGGNDGSILQGDVDRLTAALARSEPLISPLGSNTLSLPPGQEGRFHNPSRHGTTRDGDAVFAMSEWVKNTAR